MRRRQALQGLAIAPFLTGAAAPSDEFVPVAVQLAWKARPGSECPWQGYHPVGSSGHWPNSISDWVVSYLSGLGIESVDPDVWPGSRIYNLDASQSCSENPDVYHTATLRPNGRSALRVSQKDLEETLSNFVSGVFAVPFGGIFHVFTDLSRMPSEPCIDDWIWREAIRRNEWLVKNG